MEEVATCFWGWKSQGGGPKHYTLVNLQKAMANHHFFCFFFFNELNDHGPIFAMLNGQRVCKLIYNPTYPSSNAAGQSTIDDFRIDTSI